MLIKEVLPPQYPQKSSKKNAFEFWLIMILLIGQTVLYYYGFWD